MHRLFLFMTLLVLAGCAGGQKITDFSDRAVYYSWIDVSEVPGNRVTGFEIRNLSAPEDERYYSIGWEKMGDGFLVWHQGVTPGRYEYSKMWMMSCAVIICTNTINEFDFGPEGSGVGSTAITGPGQVVFAGCYAFRRTKRGFFRPGEFDTSATRCGVSQDAMLAVISENATDAMVKQRIEAAR